LASFMSLIEAVDLIGDGAHVGFGGTSTKLKPVAFAAALAELGRRGLELTTLLGSIEVDVLSRSGSLGTVRAAYVGFDLAGPASVYERALRAGVITRIEHSEFTLTAGLKAAGQGLPFGIVRSMQGTDLADEIGLKWISCPYTGGRFLAVEAIRPDVAVLHAPAATTSGAVIGARRPDSVAGYDVLIARAARTVVVTVEEILASDRQDESSSVTLLPFEVDAIVLCPGGASPTGCPGSYGIDYGAFADSALAGWPRLPRPRDEGIV